MNELDFSLNRLSLCNFIRQLTDSEYPITIRDIQKFQNVFRCIQKILLKISNLNSKNILIRLFNHSLIFFGYILIDLLMLASLNKKYVKQSYRKYIRLRFSKENKRLNEFTTFAFSAEDENLLIKTCLLLYSLHYYSASVDLLIKRYNSGLLAEETKYWLSFFLEQSDDLIAAKILEPTKMSIENYQHLPSLKIENQSTTSTIKTPLKYGLVIITLGISDIFKSCLISLLKSDYEGDIIIVEQGFVTDRTCEEFCKKWNVKYLNNSDNKNISCALNLAIQNFSPDINIIISSHSDVLWPSKWFEKLEWAWNSIYDLKKVYMINFGFLEYFRSEILDKLFVLGRYDDLIYIFNKIFSMKNSPVGTEILNIQNDDLTQTFGVGKDRWNNMPNKLDFVTGRYSAVSSFIVEAWNELEGFDSGLSIGHDLELAIYGLKNRKWGLWMNNPPFIHRSSSDTIQMSEKDKEKFGIEISKTYSHFQEKFGISIDHFISTVFAEILIIYEEEIIDAVNACEFENIDFVFDKIIEKLNDKDLKNCEIIHCRSRKCCNRNSYSKLK